jgi:DNA-directed RNA polymerase subunit RPC12/RpoP
MALSFKCSKCNSEMQEGLVVDLGYAGVLRSMWVEDPAGNSGSPGNVDNNKRKVKTITYRCSNCGFLDSYAK